MGFYYQNFVTFFVVNPTKLEFRYPLLLNARIPFCDVRDTGKVVRECFRSPEKWGDQQIVPIVAEQLTMEQICATIREVADKDVHFVPLSYDEAPLKLHQETVNNLRWYNDIGSIDKRQAEKTNEIWPKMNTFADWLRENQWWIE
jgi:nucleoside-diphosphate-sugar epimerase